MELTTQDKALLQSLADDSGETIAEILADLKRKQDNKTIGMSFRATAREKRFIISMTKKLNKNRSEVIREFINFYQQNAPL